MKELAGKIAGFTQEDIARLEEEGKFEINIGGSTFMLEVIDTEITFEDIPGWQVANSGRLTVALDITITEELRQEGLARELINRIQNMRKDNGLEVTDRIRVTIEPHDGLRGVISNYLNYICTETLADSVEQSSNADGTRGTEVEIDEGISTFITINKN
jgi:isoleucyl-tRNA synthetase